MLKLGLALAAIALLLAACSSGADDPQSAQERSADAPVAQEQQEQSATSYTAGESESVQDEAESQESAQAAQTDQSEQATADADDSAAAQQSEAQEQSAEASTENAPPAQQEQPVEDEPEQQAMVGQIIESGHRAGLLANRNIVGDLDAPIVITEYADFL